MSLIDFFKPNKGTRQWEQVLASENQEQLNWLLEHDINPKNVSLLTLLSMMSDENIQALVQKGAIVSLSDLAACVDEVGAVSDVVWQKHSLRRLIAGVQALIASFESDDLPEEVEQSFIQGVQSALAAEWKERKLPAPVLARVNQLIPVIYEESFNRWLKFTGELDVSSSTELKFWQDAVINHLQTKSYLGEDISLMARLKELRLQGALRWLHSSPEDFADIQEALHSKMIDSFVKAFQEEKLSDELMSILSAKIKELHKKCADEKKPHITKFYRDAAEQVFIDWQQTKIDDNSPVKSWLAQWMQVMLFEGGISLPEAVFKQLQNFAINQLINEYKAGKYKNRPLGLALDSALPELHEDRSIEKIHSTAGGALVDVLLERLLSEWRETSDLDENNPQAAESLMEFSLAPWRARLEVMQTMLQAMLMANHEVEVDARAEVSKSQSAFTM